MGQPTKRKHEYDMSKYYVGADVPDNDWRQGGYGEDMSYYEEDMEDTIIIQNADGTEEKAVRGGEEAGEVFDERIELHPRITEIKAKEQWDDHTLYGVRVSLEYDYTGGGRKATERGVMYIDLPLSWADVTIGDAWTVTIAR